MPPPPWPAPEPAEPAARTLPPGTVLPGMWRLGVGITVAVTSPVAVAFFLLASALSANACGPFADSCDDYGQTGDGFGWMVAGLGVSLLAFVVACGLIVSGWMDRRAARRRLLG